MVLTETPAGKLLTCQLAGVITGLKVSSNKLTVITPELSFPSVIPLSLIDINGISIMA